MSLPIIKRDIFRKLLRTEKWLKYSEVFDHEVENDLFNYHLQHLVIKGLVLKKGSKYHISDEGIKYILREGSVGAANYWVDKMKINTLNLLIKEENGKKYILHNKRKRYPFFNNNGLSGGSVLCGEHLFDAASRNLLTKTGLKGSFNKIIGSIRGTFYLKDEIYQDIFFFICLCEDYKGQLMKHTDLSENHWHSLDESIRIETDEHFGWKSLIDLYKALKTTPVHNIPYFNTHEIIKVDTLF